MEMSQVGFSTHTLDVSPTREGSQRVLQLKFKPDFISSPPLGRHSVWDCGRVRLGRRSVEDREQRANHPTQRGLRERVSSGAQKPRGLFRSQSFTTKHTKKM